MQLYTKHHLGAFPPSAKCDGIVPPAEATVFHAGDRNPLVSLDGGAAAVAVCGDAARPSQPEEAAARGATTYLASDASGAGVAVAIEGPDGWRCRAVMLN